MDERSEKRLRLRPKVGIHVRGFSAGKPVAADNARLRRAETLQIFASNPRQWRLPPQDDSADLLFRDELSKAKIGPLFLHAPYLVNLASPTKATRELSLQTVAWTLKRAEVLGAQGVVVHAGQAVTSTRVLALKRLARGISALLGDAPEEQRLILELTAGGQGAVASRLDQAVEMLDACAGEPRIALCLDTCHLHACGYELTSPAGVDALAAGVVQVGAPRLCLVHANDAKDPRGSRRDRHWHLGDGYIGKVGFKLLMAHPIFSRVPFICETPGQLDDDIRNVSFLKSLRARQTAKAVSK